VTGHRHESFDPDYWTPESLRAHLTGPVKDGGHGEAPEARRWLWQRYADHCLDHYLRHEDEESLESAIDVSKATMSFPAAPRSGPRSPPPDGAAFCPSCGARTEVTSETCAACGADLDGGDMNQLRTAPATPWLRYEPDWSAEAEPQIEAASEPIAPTGESSVGSRMGIGATPPSGSHRRQLAVVGAVAVVVVIVAVSAALLGGSGGEGSSATTFTSSPIRSVSCSQQADAAQAWNSAGEHITHAQQGAQIGAAQPAALLLGEAANDWDDLAYALRNAPDLAVLAAGLAESTRRVAADLANYGSSAWSEMGEVHALFERLKRQWDAASQGGVSFTSC
jgi:hypothetical protein